ncbi:hypothetical protein HY479_01840 [Candidatus Uhrbacteria bacterium]|nr:hypothetical protein [Candidatus Uhrbacteria bacterium]
MLGPTAHPYKEVGAAAIATPSTEVAPTAQQVQQINALCFTATECASKDYGGSASAFRTSPEYKCPEGQGRCIAPEPDIGLSSPLGNVTTVKGLKSYVAAAFNYLILIVATAAAVMFVWGGFRYIFGSAFTDIARAKEIMIDAAIGLFLSFAAVTILQTINPATLTLGALDVFLIKKQTIFTGLACDKIQSNKPLKFADAGVAPNLIPKTTETKYDIEVQNTLCNRKYHVEGLDLGSCTGSSCKEKGEKFTCLPCSGGLKPQDCGDRTSGFACGVDPFSGKVSWVKTVIDFNTDSMVPLLVCNAAQGGSAVTFDTVAANVKPYTDVEVKYDYYESVDTFSIESLANAIYKIGSTSYHLPITEKMIEEGNKFCEGSGSSFRGIVLGVPYLAISGVAESLATSLSTPDYLIVTKDMCGNTPQFAGYADGTRGRFASTLYQVAYFCAMKNHSSTPSLHNINNYWTVQDLENALSGTTPIHCDLAFNSTNAKDEPSKIVYPPAGCYKP